ncbi:hypothetical protein CDL15_Pgr019336 [Punica granatum]|uniref:C2H2-type domain-containing protein n=1 Tax=Punica granatum TaxID=22663 RepID=A0A218X720_PUNGR|nr:hypothetical protein CDL15_Pgr019336 [Punica granatum]
MEKRHKCKLCSKNFSNGRALRAHMKSHSLNLPISEEMPPAKESDRKLVYPTESASSASGSSSSSSSSEEEDEAVKVDQGYGLRENPKKSFRLADPEFSFAGSVVLQDRESETESSKNPTRRRSKRIRNCSPFSSSSPSLLDTKTKIKLRSNFSNRVDESPGYRIVEPEPVSSSISDATTEEDVAFCLMMLSRDKWKGQKRTKDEPKFRPVEDLEVEEEEEEEEEEEGEDDEEDEEEETDESEEHQHCKVMTNDNNNNKSRGKYRCETCKKTFRSYQALGGHRASHKKAQLLPPSAIQLAAQRPTPPHRAVKVEPVVKVHECPYCSRVFSSGQALGGHKRSHTTDYGTSITVPIPKKKFGDTLIDLNLPAPVEDDDFVELSAVSDAEFVYHHTTR